MPRRILFRFNSGYRRFRRGQSLHSWDDRDEGRDAPTASSRTTPLRSLKTGLLWLADAGTHGYPVDTRRRLKILNLIAYLIAVASLAFAVQQGVSDFTTYAPAIYLNLALVGLALLVPFAHRISDIAGGLLLVGAEFVALFGLTAFFSRDGGPHLHYFVAAAAPFVVLGLGRLRLVLAIVLAGLVLHVAAWFAFPPEKAMVAVGPGVLDPIYTQAAITTFALLAASVYYAFRLAESAKAETEALLHKILPGSVAERLKAHPDTAIADSFEDASILFTDILGFVPLARRLGPQRIVELLNRIISEFDRLALLHGVEKIKTIGDAYMAAAGVPEPAPDHTHRLVRLAIDMLAVIVRLNAAEGLDIRLRVGIASGPVMAGVIGTNKFSYDVWGDAVNLAARLENLGAPGRIHICTLCRTRLADAFAFESVGEIDIKGIGRQETWLLLPAPAEM